MARSRYQSITDMKNAPDGNIYLKKGNEEMKPIGTTLSHKIMSVALRDYMGNLQITFQNMYEAYEREKMYTFWVSNIESRLSRLEALRHEEEEQRTVPKGTARR